MKKHFSIRISGVVQGVFFRASTKAKADELNIKGLFGTSVMEVYMRKLRAKAKILKRSSSGADEGRREPRFQHARSAKRH